MGNSSRLGRFCMSWARHRPRPHYFAVVSAREQYVSYVMSFCVQAFRLLVRAIRMIAIRASTSSCVGPRGGGSSATATARQVRCVRYVYVLWENKDSERCRGGLSRKEEHFRLQQFGGERESADQQVVNTG